MIKSKDDRSPLFLSTLCAALSLTLAGSALAQDSPPAEPAGDGGDTATMDLPDGVKLLEKAAEAMGGMKRLSEVKSLQYKAKMEQGGMGDDLESIDISQMRPDKTHLAANFTSGESAVAVWDGEHGWANDPGEEDYEIMDPEDPQRAIFQLMSPHMFLVAMQSEYGNAKTVGMKTVGETECAHVDVMTDDGDVVMSILIDPESGKVHAAAMDNPMMGGLLMAEFKEWEEVEGIQFPAKAAVDFGGMVMNFEYNSFVLDKVEDSAFDMPDSVKKQIQDMEEAGDDDDGFEIETIEIKPVEPGEDDGDGGVV